MNKEVSATKLDIFNYQSLQSGTKAQVKVGEFVFESHSVQHLSLNDKLITWGEHHNQVRFVEVKTICCSQSRIPQKAGLKGQMSAIMLQVLSLCPFPCLIPEFSAYRITVRITGSFWINSSDSLFVEMIIHTHGLPERKTRKHTGQLSGCVVEVKA